MKIGSENEARKKSARVSAAFLSGGTVPEPKRIEKKAFKNHNGLSGRFQKKSYEVDR
jgi:hypothetical protein